MTADPPTLDGRDRAELTKRTGALAAAYTDGEWTPGAGDPGDAIVSIFGELAGALVERLDQRPQRHRIGFLDSLGFDRHPPTAARLPMTVAVADGVESVTVPEETVVLAPGTDGTERTFVTVVGSAFEATPAVLDRVYAVDPANDRVVDHRALVDGTAAATLFGGENMQRHALYLGDETLLTVASGGAIRVVVTGPTPGHVLESGLRWEYHGEDSDGQVGWHPAEVHPAAVDPTEEPDDTVTVSLSIPGEMTPTTVDGRESRFLRALVPDGLGPLGLFNIRLDDVAVGPGPLDRPPMLMLAGDIPQESGAVPDADATDIDTQTESVSTAVLPFGETPRVRDEFYVADDEVFSKTGADVDLWFYRPGADPVQPAGTDPRLSWEYWDGDRWARLAVTDGTQGLTTTGAVRFTVPPDLGPRSVAGESAHWIRVRLVGGEYVDVEHTILPSQPTELELVRTGEMPSYSAVGIDYAGDPPAEPPIHRLVENGLDVTDVAETLDGPSRLAPFTPLPDTDQTVYLGFDRSLAGGPFTLLWDVDERTRPTGFEPSVRWAYGADPEDGPAWQRAPSNDGTEGIQRTGVVALEIPERTAPRELFGVERHWLRVRVSGDQFETAARPPVASELPVQVVAIDAVTERVVLRNDGDRTLDLSGLVLDFEYDQPADQRRVLPPGTHVGPGDRLVVETGAEPPAEPAADVRFTFVRPVINSVDPDTVALCTLDGAVVHALTDDAPQRRVDVAALPDAPAELLPVDPRLPLVVDGDVSADDVASDTDTAESSPATTTEPDGLPPCDPSLPTSPPAGDPSREAPAVGGVYRNAAWAADRRRLTGERVGSSTGAPDQQFTLREGPVLDATVRVDEAAALSEAAREDLLADPDEEVTVERDTDGHIQRVFVTWTRVTDLLSSGPADRHYVLDSMTGELHFGDGTRGRKPPRARDGVRADYDVGGGRAGNVPAGALTGLKSSLPFVDGVANPIAADGGSEAEPTAAVLDRAPKELRDRDRAVTPADVERIAAAASRRLARVRCLPRMDAVGERRPGWVTLLLVPDDDGPRPRPSPTLQASVASAVRDRLPTTVVASDRLVVRGPSYVTVTVDIDVVGDGSTTVAALEARVTDALAAFLQPVTGGPAGEGWPFGRLPAPGDLFATLEDIAGVDHVADLDIRFDGDGASVTVRSGETPPEVAKDVLVAGGSHTVSATGGTQ